MRCLSLAVLSRLTQLCSCVLVVRTLYVPCGISHHRTILRLCLLLVACWYVIRTLRHFASSRNIAPLPVACRLLVRYTYLAAFRIIAQYCAFACCLSPAGSVQCRSCKLVLQQYQRVDHALPYVLLRTQGVLSTLRLRTLVVIPQCCEL